MLATDGVATSMTLSAISCWGVDVASEQASTILTLAKELGRLPVAELFPTNELLQFPLFGSDCPFDQFSLELVIGVFRRGSEQ